MDYKVGDKVVALENGYNGVDIGMVGEVVGYDSERYGVDVFWGEGVGTLYMFRDEIAPIEENEHTVRYDFNKMEVNRFRLNKTIEGSIEDLYVSFYWSGTPQGFDFWEKQYSGEAPVDTNLLKDILKQYDEWVASNSVEATLDDIKFDASVFDEWVKVAEVTEEPIKSTGGPSKYYDFPFYKWNTVNDQLEYLADKVWGKYSIHFKDIFKAGFRWGGKDGTTEEYDAKKIVYSGLRLLIMIGGKEMATDYLKELLEDDQFKG